MTNGYDKTTPEGTRDLLFQECDKQEGMQQKLMGYFRACGYRKVQTPTLEYYDVFANSAARLPQESMYKLTDNSGRILVVRPDCTVPIARLVATRLREHPLPLRLFYNQNIFKISPDKSGRSNEINQLGVELVGTDSPKADLEILTLAANALKISGRHFHIEICHIGFFKELIEALPAADGQKEMIRQFVEQKNYAALNDQLQDYSDHPAAKALKALPRLFGGEEVLQAALECYDTPKSRETLRYLESIYRILSNMGLEGKVMLDLGLVNQAEYYTGVIFHGYVEDMGKPVLSGGRYDGLISGFDSAKAFPATGFGIDIDMLASINGTARMDSSATPRRLLHSDASHFEAVLKLLDSWRAMGIISECSLFATAKEAREYATAQGIPELWILGADGEMETIYLEVKA